MDGMGGEGPVDVEFEKVGWLHSRILTLAILHASRESCEVWLIRIHKS